MERRRWTSSSEHEILGREAAREVRFEGERGGGLDGCWLKQEEKKLLKRLAFSLGVLAVRD